MMRAGVVVVDGVGVEGGRSGRVQPRLVSGQSDWHRLAGLIAVKRRAVSRAKLTYLPTPNSHISTYPYIRYLPAMHPPRLRAPGQGHRVVPASLLGSPSPAARLLAHIVLILVTCHPPSLSPSLAADRPSDRPTESSLPCRALFRARAFSPFQPRPSRPRRQCLRPAWCVLRGWYPWRVRRPDRPGRFRPLPPLHRERVSLRNCSRTPSIKMQGWSISGAPGAPVRLRPRLQPARTSTTVCRGLSRFIAVCRLPLTSCKAYSPCRICVESPSTRPAILHLVISFSSRRFTYVPHVPLSTPIRPYALHPQLPTTPIVLSCDPAVLAVQSSRSLASFLLTFQNIIIFCGWVHAQLGLTPDA